MQKPPASIFIMAFAGCDELDAIAPYEVFQTANTYLSDRKRTPRGKPVDLRIVAVDGAGAVQLDGPSGPQLVVTGYHGITFGVTAWDGTTLPDLLVVAGGGYGSSSGIGQQMNNPAFTGPIARQFARQTGLASVCTGAFGLAGAKIVAGRRMTTHPALVNQLAAVGADVVNPDWGARVVDEDGIVSCGGVTSGIDEALYLIEALWPQDPQLVADVRGYIDYPYRAATMS